MNHLVATNLVKVTGLVIATHEVLVSKPADPAVLMFSAVLMSVSQSAELAVSAAKSKDTPEFAKDIQKRLDETVRLWLEDDRPAWETIEAFERDVERIMSGDVTKEVKTSKMPLNPNAKPKKEPAKKVVTEVVENHSDPVIMTTERLGGLAGINCPCWYSVPSANVISIVWNNEPHLCCPYCARILRIEHYCMTNNLYHKRTRERIIHSQEEMFMVDQVREPVRFIQATRFGGS